MRHVVSVTRCAGGAEAGATEQPSEDADLELARAIAASMGDNAAWQARALEIPRSRFHESNASAICALAVTLALILGQSHGLDCQDGTHTETVALMSQDADPGPCKRSQASDSLQGAAAHRNPGVVVIKDPGPEPGKGPGELPRSLSCPHVC